MCETTGPAGKVAVVTGGGRGIGRGIVGELAGRGWSLVINYRSDISSAEDARREAEGRGSPRVALVAADVADPTQHRRLIDGALTAFGKFDLWVNNAGVAPAVRLDLLETTEESWDRVLGINLRGPFFLTQAARGEMLRMVSEGAVENPRIIFVTSVSSAFASVNRGEYCVSKAGLSMVAKLFAVRLAGHGISVHEVRPGVIATDMTDAVRDYYDRRIAEGLSPIRRWGTPRDVGLAVAAIAAGAFPFSTGDVFFVDGGLSVDRL